ncbi:MAG: hypothetical protein R3E39_13325 [Anaerolineae bacterium]
MGEQLPVSQSEWAAEIMIVHDAIWSRVGGDTIDLSTLIYADGPWTGLDIIAHLSSWNLETLYSLKAHSRQEQYAVPWPPEDEDRFNRDEVEHRRLLGAAHIEIEWHQLHIQMKEAVLELTPEQFQSHMMFPWREIGSVSHLLKEILKHEQQHVDDIVRSVRR